MGYFPVVPGGQFQAAPVQPEQLPPRSNHAPEKNERENLPGYAGPGRQSQVRDRPILQQIAAGRRVKKFASAAISSYKIGDAQQQAPAARWQGGAAATRIKEMKA